MMNDKIIHKAIIKDGEIRYLCNQASGTTPGKYRNTWSFVTCKNCLRGHKR